MRPYLLQDLLFRIGSVKMTSDLTEENLMSRYKAFTVERHPHIDASIYLCAGDRGSTDVYVRHLDDLVSFPGLSRQTAEDLKEEILADVASQISSMWNA